MPRIQTYVKTISLAISQIKENINTVLHSKRMAEKRVSTNFYSLTGATNFLHLTKPCPLSDPKLPHLPTITDPAMIWNIRALEYAISQNANLETYNKALFPLTCISCENTTFMMVEGKDGCPDSEDKGEYALRCSKKDCKNHLHF
ncbi:hypothetical protein TWF106_003929 [Orbilia oligospora]|uniref:Uncharacterized protein n=1 Tax=Orbilia oligospora TaxID=2813651 RepID=A0A7C8QVF1_ORBOL|nr:hypothetical protein TWF106_003929 [Orbilia oligospora]